MNLRRLAVACGLALPLAVATAAHAETSVVQADGTLVRAVAGTFGELFPGNDTFAAENPVLALDVTAPGKPLQRLLVPDSGGNEPDHLPGLVSDDLTGNVYLVWEQRWAGLFSRPLLAAYTPEGWIGPADLSSSTLAEKSNLQVAIHRNRFTPAAADKAIDRTIIDVVWSEHSGERRRTIYAPVVLLDGVFVGWNPLVDLGAQANELVGNDDPDATSILLDRPRLAPGRDPEHAAIGLAAGSRLFGLELRILPPELIILADSARADLLDRFSDTRNPSLTAISGEVRAHIIKVGVNFHPSVTSYIAQATANQVATSTGKSITQIADEVRAHIIKVGATVLGNQLGRVDPRLRISEFRGDETTRDSHLLFDVRVTSDRPIPTLPEGAQPELLLAHDAARMIVAWEGEGAVFYVQDEGDGWTEIRSVPTGPSLSARQAFNLLENRLR